MAFKIFFRRTALLVAAAIVLAAAAATAPELILVKIDKAYAGTLSKEFWRETLGVSELESSWLAVVKSDASLPLKPWGAEIEVLDADPWDKAYFYVRISRPEDIEDLSRFGQVRGLDQRTALFWSGSAEAREIIPAKFLLARLSFVATSTLSPGLSSQALPSIERPEQEAFSAPNPVISQLVAQVSKSNLTGTISDLQNFQTRYASTTACENSGTYLYDAFARMGIQTEYDSFRFDRSRYSTRNIVATLSGKTAPDRQVIVCAHYDSYSDRAETLAPGADDNGSGTAAVLEIARILSGQPVAFDYTIKFICYSAEEWGLYGSEHYAQEARSRGEKIIGVLNLDMIAYPNGTSWNLDLVVNRNSEWLADRFSSAALSYEGLGTRKYVDGSWKYSDQSSFWDNGYSALCEIEYEDTRNPYYHKTTDTLSTLNMDYDTSVTRATLAAVAELAQPVAKVTKYVLTILAGNGGTTNPVPGTTTYDEGTVVSVMAAASANYRFGSWSGDASGTTNPITVTMNSDKTVTASFIRIIYPPADLQGQKTLNRSLSQTEYINVLKWKAHPDNDGLNLVLFRIYRKQGEDLTKIADLPPGQFSFQHRRVEKNTPYDYVVVSVDGESREGDPASLTIR
ncbi:MAG: M20/M25/M40 family metallo-hydrolase [Candidatus Aminicenantes bacterium]|nr:M20/M25/M40 family metallo-hydrolase [Candidatus Aminicenantes bacterium]